MTRETIGDVAVDNQVGISYPGVTHFMSMAARVFEQTMDPCEGIFENSIASGRQVSIPRFVGVDDIREVGIDDDLSFQPTGSEIKRILIGWRFVIIDKQIKKGEDADSQVNLADDIMQKIQGGRARGSFQALANALGKVPYSDLKNQDHALGVVRAGTQWDSVNKKRINTKTDAVATAVNWNAQKIEAVRTIAKRGHLGEMSAEMPVIISSAAALGGFGEDEQSLNKDYSSPLSFGHAGVVQMAEGSWKGFRWAQVGDFPAGKGLPTKNSGTGNTLLSLEDSFALDPTCVRQVTLQGRPMHEMTIYEDNNTHSLRFRYLGCYGFGVVNPKGIIVVRNSIPAVE